MIVLAVGAAFAGLVLLLPAVSRAFVDDWGWDSWPAWQSDMQRESIAAQEEAARLPGREKRRDEVEKEQEKQSAEHEAYFSSVLEASQAALKAPAGAYYRIPGYLSADAPKSGAKSIDVGGLTYFYDQGIFWLQQGTQYIVVPAPVGAVVDGLPAAATKVPATKGPVWYYFGTFFEQKGGAYQVIHPPAGLIVFYVPEGYTQETVKGVTLLKFGDTYFKPVFIQGVLFYKVAGL
jgi:hypothetical protein